MQRGQRIGFVAGVTVFALTGVLATVVLVAFGLDGAPPGRSPTTPQSASAAPSPVGATFTPVPAGRRFPIVTRSAADLAGGRADLYVPLPGSAGRERERYPLAVLLADPRTDVTQYEQFAHEVGAYGIAVLVTARPSAEVLREARTWSAVVEASPDDYLHGLIAPSVSFVIAHERAMPRPSTWGEVRATVLLTPDRDLMWPSNRRDAVLVVCGDVGPRGGECAKRATGSPSETVTGGVPLSVTDQGRRTPRLFGDVPARRLRTINAFAQPTALWLLAHYGDTAAQREVDRLIN